MRKQLRVEKTTLFLPLFTFSVTLKGRAVEVGSCDVLAASLPTSVSGTVFNVLNAFFFLVYYHNILKLLPSLPLSTFGCKIHTICFCSVHTYIHTSLIIVFHILILSLKFCF